MSLAADFLRAYLDREQITQADYAAACGMTAANISDVLTGEVGISGRNLQKLIRGIADRDAKVCFTVAHLQDQIPQDLERDITVAAGRLEAGLVREPAEDQEERSALVTTSFSHLPHELQEQVVRLIHALRRDDELRRAFTAMMNYAVGAEKSTARKGSSMLDDVIEEDLARRSERQRSRHNSADGSSNSATA